MALLHPRHPDPFLIESSFITVGRTVQRIPFGAPDGRATDLFFLLGCPDDRLHLHLLARLCLMAQKTDVLAELRETSSAEAMYYALIQAEVAVLESQPGTVR
jgi:mannitol/fructose-specific phosphotransferase system IIA component (Ntr-type)